MIDLRSDTVTLPTPEMREAMRTAKLGDDQREGDPTVRELEALAASLVGTERALFVASGTMGNLVAQLSHAQRGTEVLLDPQAHILRSEVGGIAQIAGLFHRSYPADRGVPDVAALSAMLNPKISSNKLATGLVCAETSHNSGGGAVIPLATMAALRKITLEKGIPVHIDGARLFNAAVALGTPASGIAQYADSVTFCLSKGLSAPFGSMLCGTQDFIERARLYRRMIGGGLRQGGVVAAAGIVALKQMIKRLADDHRKARAIAEGLHGIDPRLIDIARAATNILMVKVGHTSASADRWVAALAEHDVHVGAWSPVELRLVTHRHIDDAAADATIAAFRAVSERKLEA